MKGEQVDFKVFRGTLTSWGSLFAEAAAWATRCGRENLISISHSEDQNEGVVTVWYWATADESRRDTWPEIEEQEPQ